MRLGDHDHDGNAAGLPLFVQVYPPGTFGEDRRMILVGIDLEL